MPEVTVTDVFEECQKGMHGHGKLVKNLSKIYQATEIDEFWDNFIHHMKYSLIIYRKEPAVERTLEFSAKFAASFANQTSAEDKQSSKSSDSSDEEGEEMHPFILKYFNFLLHHHSAKDKSVRFRCCQMVNKLLTSLNEEAQIDDDLYDRIYECMLQRLRDKFPSVRVQAVLALSRLQDPRDNDCPVIKAYLFLMGCDTNSDVRRAVLSVIAATTKTLAGILERTRDVKDLVRKLAYQVIAEKIHIRALTIAQRVRLLHEGLNDRSEVVKDACGSRMVQAWLRLYEGNVLELLKSLDVENSGETPESTLKTIFNKTPVKELIGNFDILNDEHVLKIEELTSESVLYWRCLAEFVQSQGAEAEEQLDKIVPNGLAYSGFMKEVLSHMKDEDNIDVQLRNEFMLHQLIRFAHIMDLTDQVGRKAVLELLRQMLLSESVSHTLVKPLVDLYSRLVVDQDHRLEQLTELISDIRVPITTVESQQTADQRRQIDLKLAGVRVQLNQLREELDSCVQNQDFARAAAIKESVSDLEESRVQLINETLPQSQEVRIEKNDPGTLLKCCTISREMMLHFTMRGLKPALQALVETLILPGVTNAEPAVRNVAVSALGLCCLQDKETARAHLLLFMQVSQLDVEVVKVSALKIIFDILLTYGLDAFGVDASGEEANVSGSEEADKSGELNESNSSDTSMLNATSSSSTDKEKKSEQANRANSILVVLISLLDSESSEVRTVAAEGLAKLMLSGRVPSHKLLSRLLLLWFNPLTEDDNHLRHGLGAFFPVYAFAGRSNQAVVEEAFMPTLTTLFNAPATSPLAEVNINNVSEFLVQLTNNHFLIGENKLATEDSCLHDSVAVSVCNEILSDPNSFNVRTLCRTLNLLDLCPQNVTTLKDLKVLTESMVKEVKDKQCVKLLEKFQKQVANALKRAQKDGLLSTPAPASRPQEVDQDTVENGSVETESNTEGVGGENAEEGETAQDRENREESNINEADTSLLQDGRPEFRKQKKGKKMLHSILETPGSSESTRSRKSRMGKSTASTACPDTQLVSEDLAEEENDECFASPTPVRRSTRPSRRNNKKQQEVEEEEEGGSEANLLESTKRNLADTLPAGGDEEETVAPSPVTRSMRNRKTRAKNNRGPLNERNEAQ